MKCIKNFAGYFNQHLIYQFSFLYSEYLFGSSSNGTYSGTSGPFHLLRQKQDIINMVTIDEAHKIFDCLPDYQPEMKLKDLG